MERKTFSIPNISCGHCTATIESELSGVEGVSRVQGNVDEKSVTVEWDAPATHDAVVQTLKEINYPAAE